MHSFSDSSRRSAAGSYDPFLAIVRDPRAHGSAWLERIPDKDEVPGSNPGGPTVREPLHSKGSRSFGSKCGEPILVVPSRDMTRISAQHPATDSMWVGARALEAGPLPGMLTEGVNVVSIDRCYSVVK